MCDSFYWSVLEVVMDSRGRGGAGMRLRSSDGVPAPPSMRRETPMEDDGFRLCEREVIAAHGGTSFVLVLNLYSASSQLSWSEGKFAISPLPRG